MLPNCILGLITNICIELSYMVFVSDVQKRSIAPYRKGLDSFIQFCSQGPAFTCIKKDG